MSLSKLKTLTTDTRDLLEADGWTVERLAYARKNDLTPYKGVGDVTAQRIIDEAELVLATLAESDKPKIITRFVDGLYASEQPANVSRDIPPTPPERMSARVKRIEELNQ